MRGQFLQEPDITLCGTAQEDCPYFPAKYRVIHRGFDEPSRLALNETTEEQILKHYRSVRDQIREYVKTLPASLAEKIDDKRHSS